MGFPPGSAEKNLRRKRCRRCGFGPWVGKISWRRAWQPTLVFLLGESHGQRGPAGYSPRGCKELDTTEVTAAHTHMIGRNTVAPLNRASRNVELVSSHTDAQLDRGLYFDRSDISRASRDGRTWARAHVIM